jgi:hypothetical protein
LFTFFEQSDGVMSHLSNIINIVLQDQAANLPDVYREQAEELFLKLGKDTKVRASPDLEDALSHIMKSARDIDDNVFYAQKVADIYLSWRDKGLNSCAPTMSQIISGVLSKLGVDHNSRLGQVCIAAALLSDLPNENKFHSNAHFRDITLTALRLCTLQNDLSTDHRLNDDNICLVLIAALLHDFGHDGQGNAVDGVHEPMRLEQRAFSLAEPVLKLFDLTDEELNRIRIMILCTDVSYGPMALSPSRVLNKCYRYFYNDTQKPDISVEAYRFVADALLEDKTLCLMAMILEESDIFTSVGLSYEYAKMTTLLVAEETEILKGNASTLHGFIEMICQGLISTPAATFLFADTFAKVYAQASDDVQNNLDYVLSVQA